MRKVWRFMVKFRRLAKQEAVLAFILLILLVASIYQLLIKIRSKIMPHTAGASAAKK
jgi:hypothetical protein